MKPWKQRRAMKKKKKRKERTEENRDSVTLRSWRGARGEGTGYRKTAMAAIEGWREPKVNPRAGLFEEHCSIWPLETESRLLSASFSYLSSFVHLRGRFLRLAFHLLEGINIFSDLRLRWVETRLLRSRPIEAKLSVTPLSAPTEAAFLIDLFAVGPLSFLPSSSIIWTLLFSPSLAQPPLSSFLPLYSWETLPRSSLRRSSPSLASAFTLMMLLSFFFFVLFDSYSDDSCLSVRHRLHFPFFPSIDTRFASFLDFVDSPSFDEHDSKSAIVSRDAVSPVSLSIDSVFLSNESWNSVWSSSISKESFLRQQCFIWEIIIIWKFRIELKLVVLSMVRHRPSFHRQLQTRIDTDVRSEEIKWTTVTIPMTSSSV